MRFGPLVTGDWLVEHLDEVRVVDVRWYLDGRSGLEAYRTGHIPGAVRLDVDRDLAGPATAADGRHPLPRPVDFAAALGRVGVADGQPVVVYDDAGGSIAARLWWMLHVLDEPVAVLDGGIAAWPGELSTDEPSYPSVERWPRPWPADRFVSADELAGRLVLDARTAERYAQGDPAIDPRPGHIPGARSAPWADNLDAGRLRSADELRAHYAAVGVAPDTPVVAYCGSGVTACLDLLALAVTGHADLALYPGSWSQWGSDASRPAAVGADERGQELTDP